MKITKIEHHSVNWHYKYEIDEEKLAEIYPDLTEEEITQLLKNLEGGNAFLEDVINDALENFIEMEWKFVHENNWTDRKGGYKITYEGVEESWHYGPLNHNRKSLLLNVKSGRKITIF